MHSALDQAVEALRSARRVVISSGAGMSAESGVETFRDAQTGHWSKFRPEDLATPQAFLANPSFVWDWYRARRAKLSAVVPHVGYEVLVGWEQRFDPLTIITQNVDGLHHRAGSQHVIELHGRLDVVCCCECDFTQQTLEDLGEEPMCTMCGAWLRPGVVWFGEMLPEGAFEAAQDAVDSCGVLMVIGTSGVVQPAASLAQYAREMGANVIEINPDPTPITAIAHVHLPEKCGAALQAINEALG